MAKGADLLLDRAKRHDDDKLSYTNLKDWLSYFHAGNHFKGNFDNTHHHKEDVSDLFGVIEMFIDWCSASYRRNGKLLDPETNNIPYLDWNSIARNTLIIVVSLAQSYFDEEILGNEDYFNE